MEENTLPMQALVMAHACYGHNSFFKGNYLFRSWTDAGSIVDYLIFARQYIAQCEERYGVEEVESLLDSCHALMNYGVDRYKRPQKSRWKKRNPARRAARPICKARSTTCGKPSRAANRAWRRSKLGVSRRNRRKTCSTLWKKRAAAGTLAA